MSDSDSVPAARRAGGDVREGDTRLVYLIPEDSEQQVRLSDIIGELWSRRIPIAVVGFFFGFVGIAYSLLAEEWWRAEVLMLPSGVDSEPALSGAAGALASLAGTGLGADRSVEALAILESKRFAREFIEDRDLLHVLLSDQWDPVAERWIEEDPAEWPDIRDAVEKFQDSILEVTEDPATGLVRLAVEWTDPGVAAEWANELVDRINRDMKEEALAEAESNIGFLTSELAREERAVLRESTARLVVSEFQKLMLARGDTETAFEVLDPAVVPKRRESPKRTMIVIASGIVGGLLAVSFFLFRFLWIGARARD